jgi:hypothetical protein
MEGIVFFLNWSVRTIRLTHARACNSHFQKQMKTKNLKKKKKEIKTEIKNILGH